MTRSSLCRGCAAEAVEVFSLGETPVANALLTAEQLGVPEPRHPLDLAMCPSCALVQLTETLPPKEFFTDYPYFTSIATTAVESARALIERLTLEYKLGPDDLVVEIASNDGYLLEHYARRGIQTLGVEPAANVAAVAEERGIATVRAFFDEEVGASLRSSGHRAAVLHANNVLAHVPDPNSVLRGVATLLKDDGVFVIETPYVRHLVDRLEFDTIYHEHVFYYSLTSLDGLLRRAGLVTFDVEHLPVHGGSLRVFASIDGRPVTDRVLDMLHEERSIGLDQPAYFTDFGIRVRQLIATLRDMVGALTGKGRRLAAYGAAAKGVTLLTVADFPPGTIEFVADLSPHKQGRFMPGLHLPIVSPAALLERQPDVVLLLAWNLTSEVLSQQREYLARGGQFMIPVPEPKLIGAEAASKYS